MGFDIANVVHSQDHAMSDFALKSDVHLEGTWCLEVRRKSKRNRIRPNPEPLSQEAADITAVLKRRRKGILRLVGVLQRDEVGCRSADRDCTAAATAHPIRYGD